MPTLAEVREEFVAKQEQLSKIRQEAGPEFDLSRITAIDGDSEQKGAEIRRRQVELAALGKQKDELESLEIMLDQTQRDLAKGSEIEGKMFVGGTGGTKASTNGHAGTGTIADVFRSNKSYQLFRSAAAPHFSVDLPFKDIKALITLTTVSPQNMRRPDPVTMALEERTIIDLMMQTDVDRGVVEYYEETTFTNNATMTAEGAAKTESDWAVTLRSDAIRKVAHWFQATKESLDDVPWLESQLRGRLAFGVRRKEEQQVISGDGTGQNITGLINRSGIQTQARGADSNMDAIYKAMQKVRGSAGTGFAEPTAIVIHPDNFTAIKLAKSTDGVYLYGAPADEGVDRLWGLPLRQTTAITANTALVGAFRPYAEVLRREGITVLTSSEHASFMTENKLLIVAESRLGLAVTRPSAFATVTGLTT